MRACISVSHGCHLVQLSCSVVLYVVLWWVFFFFLMVLCLLLLGGGVSGREGSVDKLEEG